MSWSIALNVEESFAEVMAVRNETVKTKRWFLPGAQFSRLLMDWFKSEEVLPMDRALVSTSWAQVVLNRNLSHPPCLLVTSGFEGWLSMNSTRRSPSQTSDPNHILGVSERTLASGEVITSISPDDIEFLIAKLKLMKSQSVAICLLNSRANPENELKLAAALKEGGFRTFLSHQAPDPLASESKRWSQTLEKAYIDEPFRTWLTGLLEIFKEVDVPSERVWIAQSEGFCPVTESFDAAETGAGRWTAVRTYNQSQLRPFLYLGLEEFFAENHGPLTLQPMQVIESGPFGIATFAERQAQYETGPMGWGRGFQATVLDVVRAGTVNENPPEIWSRFTERGVKRYQETLMTLSRSLVAQERVQPDQLSEILADEIREVLAPFETHLFMGPLAKSFAHLAPPRARIDERTQGFEICQGLLRMNAQ